MRSPCAVKFHSIRDFGYDTNACQVSICISNVRTALNAIRRRKRQGVAMMYIKTITNSLFTTRRMANAGSPQLNSILGCEDCVDDLSHYLQCDIGLHFACSAMKLHNLWASPAGINKIGLPFLDPIHICTARALFECYHTIRNDYATILDGCFAHN